MRAFYKRRESSAFFYALILSILLQIPFLKFLIWQSRSPSEFYNYRVKPFSAKITMVKEDEKKERMPQGQIVTLPRPLREEKPPPNAKYLSRYDTKTKKEMKAKPISLKSIPKEGIFKKKIEESIIQSPESKSFEKTEIKTEGDETFIPKKDRLIMKDKAEVVDKFDKEKMAKLLLPNATEENALGNLQAMTGSVSSTDALLDVEDEGEETILNSKSFKYWDFFYRIKEAVRKEWDPAGVYRARDPYGKIYGVKDRFTVLRITLDKDGKVVRMETIRKSGIPFLDEEAKRAFKEAQPFPNPPKPLFDKNNQITFNFGFLFEITRSGTRFFWGR